MVKDQGTTTFKTVGDLKQGLQGLSDDTILGFSQIGQQEQAIGQQDQSLGSVEGISMVQDGDRVTFGAVQQGGSDASSLSPS